MSLQSAFRDDMAKLNAIRNQIMHGRNGDFRAMADAFEAMVDFHVGKLTPTVPPAPMGDDGLPAYVVEGEWESLVQPDPVKGSLLHPYDVSKAFSVTLQDGRRLAFPDEASAMKWADEHPEFGIEKVETAAGDKPTAVAK